MLKASFLVASADEKDVFSMAKTIEKAAKTARRQTAFFLAQRFYVELFFCVDTEGRPLLEPFLLVNAN